MKKFKEIAICNGRLIQVENDEEVKTNVIVKSNGIVMINQLFSNEDRECVVLSKEQILALADQIREGE